MILKVKKRPFAKNTWYDWLIYYIPKPIKQQWVVVKIELWSFSKQPWPEIIVNQHVPKIFMVVEKLKNLKTKKQSEDTISKNITNTKQ